MMKTSSPTPKRMLGIESIALMAVAAMDSLRNLPTMAIYGWSSVTWYVLGTLLFLLPLALVAAELATGWPVAGGVYAWVREAFGEQWAFWLYEMNGRKISLRWRQSARGSSVPRRV